MRLYQEHQEHIRQLVCEAGDVAIFTEAVTHGTLPWTAEHPRRSILTRYTAGNMAYVPAYEIPNGRTNANVLSWNRPIIRD